MGFAVRHVVPLTTDASGNATGYSPLVTGRIVSIRYAKTDYADGVDFDITSEATGQTIWSELNVNAAKTCAPRMALHDTAGAAALFAAGGTAQLDQIVLANDRVKIVVAQGGNAKSGAFHILVE